MPERSSPVDHRADQLGELRNSWGAVQAEALKKIGRAEQAKKSGGLKGLAARLDARVAKAAMNLAEGQQAKADAREATHFQQHSASYVARAETQDATHNRIEATRLNAEIAPVDELAASVDAIFDTMDNPPLDLENERAQLQDQANRNKSAAEARGRINSTATPLNPDALVRAAQATGHEVSNFSPDGSQWRVLDPDRAHAMADATRVAESAFADRATSAEPNYAELQHSRAVIDLTAEANGIIHDVRQNPILEPRLRFGYREIPPAQRVAEQMAIGALPSIKAAEKQAARGDEKTASKNRTIAKDNMDRTRMAEYWGYDPWLKRPKRSVMSYLRHAFSRKNQ